MAGSDSKPWYKKFAGVVIIVVSFISGVAALLGNFKSISEFFKDKSHDVVLNPTDAFHSTTKKDGLAETNVISLLQIVKKSDAALQKCNFEIIESSGRVKLDEKSLVKDFSLPPGRYTLNRTLSFTYPARLMRTGPTMAVMTCDSFTSKASIVD